MNVMCSINTENSTIRAGKSSIARLALEELQYKIL